MAIGDMWPRVAPFEYAINDDDYNDDHVGCVEQW